MPTEEQVLQAAESVFKAMDLDNSGWLSEQECKEFAMNMHQNLAAEGAVFDEDAFKKGFEKTDKNGDGKVFKKELLNAIKKKTGL
mmetsp:Transcript_20736/g.28562  ORF Transcript_20736/g.28562 Transcript_20736/m.28562 type:complete len:85 (-) Transcript_20736:1162-1416(-)